jgi:hypothetical protein
MAILAAWVGFCFLIRGFTNRQRSNGFVLFCNPPIPRDKQPTIFANPPIPPDKQPTIFANPPIPPDKQPTILAGLGEKG